MRSFLFLCIAGALTCFPATTTLAQGSVAWCAAAIDCFALDPALSVTGPVEIPLVFHVLYDDDGTGNLPDATLYLALDSLNRAFASDDVSFRVVGINRVQNSAWFEDVLSSGSRDEISQALRVDVERVLNVYTGDGAPAHLGYGYCPNPELPVADGVYVKYTTFPGSHPWQTSPPFEGNVLVHEVGHYLGLRHTFQGSNCAGGDTPPGCETYGDLVCDTPAEASAAYGCPTGRNTCTPIPDGGPDPIDNYMDYTDDACRQEFTPGQFVRMRRGIGNFRLDLVANDPLRFDADLVVGADESWAWFDTELRFAPGTGVLVEGTLTADDVVFTAGDPAQGWSGIVFDPDDGADAVLPSTLISSIIEDVKGPLFVSGDAAVEVYGGTVTLSGSEIRDGTNVHGLWASGPDALVTLDGGSIVENMSVDGTGVVAAEGAEVRVYDSFIQENGYTGAGATGTGSRLYLYQSQVLDNAGYGVGSETYGEVFFNKPGTPVPTEGVAVNSHELKGGLYALAYGDITAGIYDENDPGFCVAACQNFIVDNWQGSGNFDAKSVGGAVLWGEYNFWGQNRTLVDLELVTGTGGFLDVTPLWNGIAPRMGGSPAPRGALEVPAPLSVAALVDEAYTAAALGDTTAASAALLAAMPLAVSPEEHGLAYGTTARFLGHAIDPALEAYLSTRTASGDAARPYALTALLAAYAAQDRPEEAWAAADALTTGYGETEHALPGLAMTVRLAADVGDLISAEAALAGLQAGWTDLLETEAAEVLVRRLQGGGTSAGRTGPTARARVEAGEGVEGFRLLGARPNPVSGGTTVVPFEVSETSRVRVAVYDVLGREVAVLADGVHEAGRYEAAFDGGRLAAGLYLVRARVEAAGVERRYVERITLLR